MIQLVRSHHDGMMAEVTVDGHVAPEFEVRDGLRHGCVLASTIINLYFNMVIGQWTEKSVELGIDMLYKCGGKLVGEDTDAIARFSDFQFADDLATVATTIGEYGEGSAHTG